MADTDDSSRTPKALTGGSESKGRGGSSDFSRRTGRLRMPDFEGLPEAPEEISVDFDEEAAQSEVKRLRGTINALGDVNPLALEEYEEEKERLDFLQEQQADLEEAEDTLLDTIQEINSTAAARFFETFDQIKDSFGDIFTELFGEGASAELKLEDPDDPIDSPIEIVAKPRGKRPVTLDQLSSGEKALTATALLFAIYLVKPSPFCVLDEVDAPLDDANVERFMSLVRRFEDDTRRSSRVSSSTRRSKLRSKADPSWSRQCPAFHPGGGGRLGRRFTIPNVSTLIQKTNAR
ncbi:MAG: hypothetical protein BRD30_13355 [Bacteroidetes bacterium QH_2_63_10]|nr:MAG: hypothetical protein BRD30_13355 [Bacteroidetes bacterium QH_2_63_10]